MKKQEGSSQISGSMASNLKNDQMSPVGGRAKFRVVGEGSHVDNQPGGNMGKGYMGMTPKQTKYNPKLEAHAKQMPQTGPTMSSAYFRGGGTNS